MSDTGEATADVFVSGGSDIADALQRAYDEGVKRSLHALDRAARAFRAMPSFPVISGRAFSSLEERLESQKLPRRTRFVNRVAAYLEYTGRLLIFRKVPFRQILGENTRKAEYDILEGDCRRVVELADSMVASEEMRYSQLTRYKTTCSQELRRLEFLRGLLVAKNNELYSEIDRAKGLIEQDLAAILAGHNGGLTDEQRDDIVRLMGIHQFPDSPDPENIKRGLFDAMLHYEHQIEQNQHDVNLIDEVHPTYFRLNRSVGAQYDEAREDLMFARRYRAGIVFIAFERLKRFRRAYLEAESYDVRKLISALGSGIEERYLPSSRAVDDDDPLDSVFDAIDAGQQYREDVRGAFRERRKYDALQHYKDSLQDRRALPEPAEGGESDGEKPSGEGA